MSALTLDEALDELYDTGTEMSRARAELGRLRKIEKAARFVRATDPAGVHKGCKCSWCTAHRELYAALYRGD